MTTTRPECSECLGFGDHRPATRVAYYYGGGTEFLCDSCADNPWAYASSLPLTGGDWDVAAVALAHQEDPTILADISAALRPTNPSLARWVASLAPTDRSVG